MKNKGFSLVELIVVIAIMAILVGVAVPVYTSYIEKANKSSDIQLVDEIKHAMQLAYADQSLTESAYVKITATGATASTQELEDVLAATFGGDWSDALALKYDGWKGLSPNSYANTSYYGNESELVDELSRLTTALGTAVKVHNLDADALGENFNKFLGEYGYGASSSATAIGNTAALYVADRMAGNETFVAEAAERNLLGGAPNVGALYSDLSLGFMEVPEDQRVKIGNAASLSVIYALAEGFARYCDAQPDSAGNFTTQFHSSVVLDDVKTAQDAFNVIQPAFNTLLGSGQDYVEDYLNDRLMIDLAGFTDIMRAVDNNADLVDGNLDSETCFTDGKVETMLDEYAALGLLSGFSTADGEVAVAFVVTNDEAQFIVVPFGLDK